MYANNLEQLISFTIFIITGIIISLIFDMFRVIRRVINTSDFITYIEDFLFWIFAMIIILSSIFIFNNGELRLYIFIGIFAGILLYIIFISKYFIILGEFCFKILKNIFRILFKPIKFIFKTLKIIILKLTTFIIINSKKTLLKIKNIYFFDKKT